MRLLARYHRIVFGIHDMLFKNELSDMASVRMIFFVLISFAAYTQTLNRGKTVNKILIEEVVQNHHFTLFAARHISRKTKRLSQLINLITVNSCMILRVSISVSCRNVYQCIIHTVSVSLHDGEKYD